MKRLVFAAAMAVAITAPAGAQTNIVILTGSTSGVYYPLGNAISNIFVKAIPGARSSVQVTSPTAVCIRLYAAVASRRFVNE